MNILSANWSMTADKMREVLGSHCDFKNEKSRVERYLSEDCGHIVYMLPKYHCELNPIECVWAQVKDILRHTAITKFKVFETK